MTNQRSISAGGFVKSKLARRQLFYILIFSSAITLMGTLFQLFLEYRTDVAYIHEQFQQIKQAHLKSLTWSLWKYDNAQINTQLKSMLSLRDIIYLEISDKGKVLYTAGDVGEQSRTKSRLYEMIYNYQGIKKIIGTMKATASFEGLIERMRHRIIVILFTQGVKTFFVSLFILFVINYFVIRHMGTISEFTQRLQSETLDRQLILNRPATRQSKHDELDLIVTSINDMRARIINDILKIKTVEEELKESEERFRTAFNADAIGRVLTGIDGTLLHTNRCLTDMLGYSPEEFSHLSFTDITYNEDIAASEECVRCLLAKEQDTYRLEKRYIRKDGSILWAEVSTVLLFDEDGKPIHFITGIQDISNRKLAEQELKKHRDHLEELVKERTDELEVANKELVAAKVQAEAANAYKSDFLARMSHEIRTPLNAVTGLTNILLKSELSSKQRDYLNKVQLAAENLLTVINDILDFSKVEAGRLALDQRPFELDQLMEQLTDLFSDQVAEKDLELIFAVKAEVPRYLKGDNARLAQVLTNLIANAVKFTETGEIVVGVEPAESVENRPGQTALKFIVSDTGCGIAREVLPDLFEPFIQADSYLTRQHEGTGLGLAICRRLVELMDGRIWAESTLGRGSSFSFTVMLEVRKEAKPTLSLPEDLHGLKTLVVDDSESARQVLVNLLESFTFNVSAVDSGDKAIEALCSADQDEPYQLVLLDWKMPGMDGIETVTRICNDLKRNRPPIILLVTAYGREIVKEYKNSTVLDAMLLKPVKPSQLFNTIIELLGRSGDAVVCRAREPEHRPTLRVSGRRVLVVEDSELNRDVAEALLGEAGFLVETAVNGQLAVDMLKESPRGYYDVVFMDVQMPVMDGYEATKRIREFEKQQAGTSEQSKTNIPIIALTAHALKGEKEKCLVAGMDDYLPKPIDEEDLYRVLLKWIAS